jgi:pimeloyl-ACP methyl ester carboxylesterase
MQLPSAIREIYPFTSHWIDVQGRRMHYVDEGDSRCGPSVVLLHGNPTWSFLYREIIPNITHTCRAIAPDYIGFGLSDKPPDERWYTLENHTKTITDFIAQLELERIILVVQDWGGPIGIGYALEHLENVAGMLIMNTWAWPEPSPFHASVFPWRLLHAPFVGAHVLVRCNALVERGLYLATGDRAKMKPGPVLEGYRFQFTEPGSAIGVLAFPRNIPLKPGDLNWDRMARMKGRLGELTFPCRLLWGAQDNVFPPENAALFEKLLPNCSPCRMIRNGKHFVQEDAPQEIAEEILALVEQSNS